MQSKYDKRLNLTRPYDVELEQQLLGRLLLENERAEPIIMLLEPDHFADEMHGRIYYAILAAIRAGKVASPFTLKNEFMDDTAMKTVGGVSYLAAIAGQAKDCHSVLEWAKAIRGLWFRRRLIETAREIQDAAQSAPVEYEPERLAEHAEGLIGQASMGALPVSVDKFRPIGDIARDVLQQLSSSRGEPSVMFGLKGLDDATGGMRPKELIIVGARPGMGKTAFAGRLALSVARQGKAVAFFSMEMAAPAITLRLVTATAFENGHNVAYEAARRSVIGADAQQALFEAEAELARLPIRIHEGRGLIPSGLLMAAKRLQNEMRLTETPLGIVIIDHIQKIRPERDCKGNKVAEMTEISDALQKMAGTLDVPIVALSQLNRLVEGRTDKKPELSDLRESGAIEQDADLVLLLYREAYYVKKKEPHPIAPEYSEWMAQMTACRNKLDVHIAKQRNGPEGRMTVFFDAPSSALKDW